MTDQELWERYAGQGLIGILASEGASGDGYASWASNAEDAFLCASEMMKERADLLKKSPIPWEEES